MDKQDCKNIALTVLMGSPMFQCSLYRKEFPKRCNKCPKFEQKDRPDRETIRDLMHFGWMLGNAKMDKRITSEEFSLHIDDQADQIIALFPDRFEVEDEFVKAFAKDYKETHEALHKIAIEEAKREERVAIFEEIEVEYPELKSYFGKAWQALKGEK